MMMAWKHHSELTLDEMEREAKNLAGYFDDCVLTGQGINTKERVRYRACFDACLKDGRFTETDRWADGF